MTITVVLTSGTQWTVPPDFDPLNNTVEGIAGGGGGAYGDATHGGGGGAGGQYRIKNIPFDPAGRTTINYQIGQGGVSRSSAADGGDGTDTIFDTNGNFLQPRAGLGGKQTGAGGIASAIGGGNSTQHNAGSGGAGGSGSGLRGGGGGGSGGHDGNGQNGVAESSGLPTDGGAGGSNSGGVAGPYDGGNGGNGTGIPDSGVGSGGGGAGENTNGLAGDAGNYGGGGGGCSNNATRSGAGANGVIVIKYEQLPQTRLHGQQVM